MGIENPVHLLFIAAVALVVLGPRRLPELARSLGKGIREFREAINDGSATGAPREPVPGGPVASQDPAPGGPVASHEPTPGVAVASHESAPGVAVAPPPDAVVVAPSPEPAPPQQVDPGEPVRSGDHAPD